MCDIYCIIIIIFFFFVSNTTGNFNKDFHVIWSHDHVTTSPDGRETSLTLDQHSGSGFASNDKFLFGKIDMNIKLVPGNSAGTVVAYYLSSDDGAANIRDEIDFEFLGRAAGEPYLLQTNLFVNGKGNREERIALWFDPTLQFHTYSILWNNHLLLFMVDSVPIRVYKNQGQGVAFPMSQALSMKGTIWNGESWATDGGNAKIDWSRAPFTATFSDCKINEACVASNPLISTHDDDDDDTYCRRPDWWNYTNLTSVQWRLYKWVRLHHLVYDYCRDAQRWSCLPKECWALSPNNTTNYI